MMIFECYIGEKLLIGDDVKIIVLSAAGKKVSVGIKAPKSIPVYRTEIYNKNKLKRNNSFTGNGAAATCNQ